MSSSQRQAGCSGEGKEACAAFFGDWFAAFPDARVDVQAVHIIDDVAVEEGTFFGTQNGVLQRSRGRHPTNGPSGRSGLYSGAPLSRR